MGLKLRGLVSEIKLVDLGKGAGIEVMGLNQDTRLEEGRRRREGRGLAAQTSNLLPGTETGCATGGYRENLGNHTASGSHKHR